ncbi:glycosyltransferase family 2 protein [uncultured Croceitalea sp.]|uniref:glycosyltransferase family 2 protein n=1 Tax=uncultured Croceitalea sp. TaxID=1798908 RepID=UPI00330561D8
MKLSILIPIFNVENYIANCLDSVINQDIPSNEYEIIIIDDGSTDNSKAIAAKYAEKHDNIKMFSHMNIGLYATRNKLLELAKGEYIYNLDSDDYIVHYSLGTILNIAIEKGVDIIGFNYKKTKKLDLYKSQKEVKELNYEIETGNNFLSTNHTHYNTVWWYIIRRDFLIAKDIKFDENNPLGDGPFTLRIIHLAEKMLYLPLDIHRYVQVTNSIMNNQSKSHLIKMIENYMEIFERYNLLIDEISRKNKANKMNAVVSQVRHWRDLNIKVLISKLIKSDVSIKEIISIIGRLKKIDSYPIKYYIGIRFNSPMQKLITYVYNRRTLLLIIIPLIRMYNKLALFKEKG